jgi:hypothetical protein
LYDLCGILDKGGILRFAHLGPNAFRTNGVFGTRVLRVRWVSLAAMLATAAANPDSLEIGLDEAASYSQVMIVVNECLDQQDTNNPESSDPPRQNDDGVCMRVCYCFQTTKYKYCDEGHYITHPGLTYAALHRLFELLDEAYSGESFFNQQLQKTDDATQCSICLELLASYPAAMLPCAHIFHSACAGQALADQALWSECRGPTSKSQLVSVATNGLSTAMGAFMGSEACNNSDTFWSMKNGSKLSAVAARIRHIRAEDP